MPRNCSRNAGNISGKASNGQTQASQFGKQPSGVCHFVVRSEVKRTTIQPYVKAPRRSSMRVEPPGTRPKLQSGGAFIMRRPCTLLVCVLFTFAVSVLIPAQDLAEAAYSESEGLFCDRAPVFATTSGPDLQLVLKSRAPFYLDAPIRLSKGSEIKVGSAYFIGDSLAGLHHLLRC